MTACEQAVRNAAQRHAINVLELSVMPDHVHAVVEIPFSLSASKALQLLKGCSSRALFQLEPKFRLCYWRWHFWGCSYFQRSVGVADAARSRGVCKDNDARQRSLSAY